MGQHIAHRERRTHASQHWAKVAPEWLSAMGHRVDQIGPVLQTAGVQPRPRFAQLGQIEETVRIVAGLEAMDGAARGQVGVREQIGTDGRHSSAEGGECRRTGAGADNQQRLVRWHRRFTFRARI